MPGDAVAGFAGRFGCVPPPETKEELDDPMRSPHPGEPGSCLGPELPKVKCESHSVISNSATTWTEQSREFSRPEYWSG